MWSSGGSGSQQLFGKGVELNNELENGDSILLLWATYNPFSPNHC